MSRKYAIRYEQGVWRIYRLMSRNVVKSGTVWIADFTTQDEALAWISERDGIIAK